MAKMLVEGSGRRIHNIDEHVGAATAGLMPDARQLVTRAREESRAYRQNFGEAVPPRVLNERMGGFLHTFTVYWYLRPFGASILLAGYDRETKSAELYCCSPTGQALVRTRRWILVLLMIHTTLTTTPFPPFLHSLQRYYGMALGKGARAAKTELEKLKFGERTVEESLGLVAKILLGVHDNAKDKPMEVELSVVSEATGWKHTPLSKERRDAAVAWAKAQIEAEEAASDEEDDD
jgi:20S proteasome subunit alpha 7